MIFNRLHLKLVFVVALLILALTELSCFVFFKTFKDRFTFHDVQDLLFRKENLEKAKKVYDRDLGWLRKYETPYGERLREKDYGRGLIATYGDSYTHCDQVLHNQTFQTFLAKKLKADVYNFGVGGYGTDQAFLRFRREYQKVKTPIVALGLITENINRIVNVYRRFYYQKTELSLPKPRFKLAGGHLNLLPNPLQGVEEIPKLLNPEYVTSLGANDWWYNREQYPELRFPYTEILFNKRLWLEALHGRNEEGISDTNARPWEDLWNEPGPRDLMFAIFDAFNEEVKDSGAIPLILLLPRKREVLEKFKGERPAAVKTIIQYCRKKNYYCFNGIQAISKSVSSKDEILGLYTGHLTAAGNKLIAYQLFRFLLKKKIILLEKTGKKKRYILQDKMLTDKVNQLSKKG